VAVFLTGKWEALSIWSRCKCSILVESNLLLSIYVPVPSTGRVLVSHRFADSMFNQALNWNVASVSTMRGMFQGSPFNQDISMWNVERVRDLDQMFRGNLAFNQNIQEWQLRSLESARRTFNDAEAFNQDLCPWRTFLPQVILYGDTFLNTACPDQSDPFPDSDIGPFCFTCEDVITSSPTATPVVTDPIPFGTTEELRSAVVAVMAAGTNLMADVFRKYGPIEDWDVSGVTSFDGVFLEYDNVLVADPYDLSGWEVGQVVSMECKHHIDARVQSPVYNSNQSCLQRRFGKLCLR
jgi:Mycoplasma protein of unknown function, DUF285